MMSLRMSVVALATASLTIAPAHADTSPICADYDVVFARGTGDGAGIGWMGEAFVNDLKPRLGGKSLSTYGVEYPASQDWETGVMGIRDAKNHIVTQAATCPNTKMILGGFSQGAAVMGFVTSDALPEGVDPNTVPSPMEPQIASHIASVVLFGTPNARAMGFLNQPNVVIGSLYRDKTMLLCADEDPVCSEGLNFSAHNSYVDNGMVSRAADFAARGRF